MKILCEDCIKKEGLTVRGVGIEGICDDCREEKLCYLTDDTLTPNGIDFGEMEGYST